jgi:YHS domain-containing protein
MKIKVLLFASFMFVTGLLIGQDVVQTRKKEFNLENGVAIQGYDPVSYFTVGKAIEGKKEFAFEFRGITYRFSNAANRELFKASPEKFEPTYGGWCAYAMGANNEKIEIDPETFKILDGKLYLFYNQYFNNTLKSWNKDELNLRKRADANWLKFFHP